MHGTVLSQARLHETTSAIVTTIAVIDNLDIINDIPMLTATNLRCRSLVDGPVDDAERRKG